MTTDSSTDIVTITTVSGTVREIPEHLVDMVVGLDSEGRLVVDAWDSLNNPKSGSSLFGMTLCCDAWDKGGEDSVYCRACYGAKPNADEGAYLFAWETDGVYGYPELDPISDKPRPVRFEVRKDAVHNYYGIWALDEQTWVTDLLADDSIVAAGVNMWRSKYRAQEIAAELNAEVADGLGEDV